MSQLFDTAETGFTPHSYPAGRVCNHDEVSRLAPEQAKVERTISYMVDHLTERLNINTLASRVHASPSYFFAMFKRQTGFAPIDFFIHLRMFRACALLDHTRLSVKEIAAALGYEDAFYFSRLFKSTSHVAPTDFRFLPAGIREGIKSSTLPEVCSHLRPTLSDTTFVGLSPRPGLCFSSASK